MCILQEVLSSLESKLKPFTGPGAKASMAQVHGGAAAAAASATAAAASRTPPLLPRCLPLPPPTCPARIATHAPALQLDPLDRAQAHLALAHAAHSLMQLYLQASGVDPDTYKAAGKEGVRLLAAPPLARCSPCSAGRLPCIAGQPASHWQCHKECMHHPARCRFQQRSSPAAYEVSSPPTRLPAFAPSRPPPLQERLKQYSKKVRKLLSEKELKESRRTLEVCGLCGLCGLLECCRGRALGHPDVHGSVCRNQAAALSLFRSDVSVSSFLLFMWPISLQVNVAAVNRFISAAVPDLSREQKTALKGSAGQRQATSTAAVSAASAAAGEATGSGRKRRAGAGGGGAAAAEEEAEAADAAAAFLQDTMAELQQEPGQQQEQQAAGVAAKAAGKAALPAGRAKKQRGKQ
jgi:hypothetical protein